jgi:molybdopterin-synthase adenylyltransferase
MTKQFQVLEEILPKIPKIIGNTAIVKNKDAIQFRGGSEPVILRGKMTETLSSVLKLLDGKHSLREIVHEMGENNSDKVYYIIWLLQKSGLLEDEATSITTKTKFTDEELIQYNQQLVFFSQYINTTKSFNNRYEMQHELKDSNMLIIGSGRIMEKAVQLLGDVGIGKISVIPYGKNKTIKTNHVRKRYKRTETILHDIYSSEDIKSIIDKQAVNLLAVVTPTPIPLIYTWANTASLERKIPWTRMTISEHEIVLGPTVIPFETACYTCFENRFQTNNPYFEEDRVYGEYLNRAQEKQLIEYSFLAELADYLFVFEVMRILSFFSFPTTYGALYSMDILSGQTRLSHVLKLPRCPSCSITNIVPPRRAMSEFGNRYI